MLFVAFWLCTSPGVERDMERERESRAEQIRPGPGRAEITTDVNGQPTL